MFRVGDSCLGIRTRLRDAPSSVPYRTVVTPPPICLRRTKRTRAGCIERSSCVNCSSSAASMWPPRRCRGVTSLYTDSPEDASVSTGTAATLSSSPRPDDEPVDPTRPRSRASVTLTESPSLPPMAAATALLTGGSTCNVNRLPKSSSQVISAPYGQESPTSRNRNPWRTRSVRPIPASSATADARAGSCQLSSSPPSSGPTRMPGP
jgi:hypothetical protein